MKKVSVKTLVEGMVFSGAVYIEGNNLLVPAGLAIRKKDIDRLVSWGIDVVYTDGEVTDPPTQGNAAPSNPAAWTKSPRDTLVTDLPPTENTNKDPKKLPINVLSPAEVQENKGAYRSYIDLIERLDEVFFNISSGISVEARSIDNIAARVLQSVRDERDSIIAYILGGEVSGHEMAKSSVNVAIISALIGRELKLPNHKVMQLITAALIHDIGMLRLPKGIIDKRGGLSNAEMQRMQTHPLYANKIINKELLYPEEIGIIALQHHERWDGEGYPRRLAGTAIDMGARIVSVADAFEAMVSQKPYRNSLMGYQAIKNLLSDNSRRFDPDVLKAFIQIMGIYPIGSIILLNNGALARVTEVQGIAPLRPKIKILIDEFGKMYKQDEGESIDLLVEKNLFIARAVDPKEFVKKNA
ncbi:MAG: HD-GYP domain-containing protein [Treponema sp.]|jgi:HD-GYP domain-containing protein (c-di-GMP phosphodiesterase class II)|nr:HD-GYP domain-containing protein [Treponema sp.]